MKKWRVLVGMVSVVQLVLGICEFYDYSRSVGATGDTTGGWIYSGLGLMGLLVLALPRCGIPVAVMQVLTACYALLWLPIAILSLSMPTGLLLPPPLGHPAIALLILVQVGKMALLCLLSALGTWRVARLTMRCISYEGCQERVRCPAGFLLEVF
jgi:hypothetical protein